MTSSARQAGLPGKCCLVQYCADVGASAFARKKTKRAMQGERKPCKGAKGVRGQLEGGCLRVSAATVRVSLGFQAAEVAVWVGLRRLCHDEDEKGVEGGSGAYMNQVQRFSRGISGLVGEYIIAIDVTRARLPADAHCSHESVRAGKAVR